MTVENTDLFLVSRSGTNYSIESQNLMARLEDNDLMLVSRDGINYKVTGLDVKNSIGIGGNDLVPSSPPFGSVTTLDTDFSSDGRIGFSTDGVNYYISTSIPINTTYYVDWTSGINTIPHGSTYISTITSYYSDIDTTTTTTFSIVVDKLPGSISLGSSTGTTPLTFYEADTLYPSEFNAPTSIWVSTNSSSAQLQVGRGGWFTAPTSPDTNFVSPNEELLLRHQTLAGSETVTTTTLYVGYGSAFGENVSSSFITTNEAVGVNTPSITSPTDGATDVNPNSLTVVSSAYSTFGAAGTHVSSDWEIASDSGFTSIVDSLSASTSNLESWTRTYTAPATFYVRTRHRSANGYVSGWSAGSEFTTSVYYDWRVVVTLGAAKGGNGSVPVGRNGGSGSFTLDSTDSHSSPPGTLAWITATQGQTGYVPGGSGGSGYAGGGNGHTYTRQSGGGGGSTVVKLDGTAIAVAGGGGGGGGGDTSTKGRGGQGGGVGLAGDAGESHDHVPGGAGGSVSLSAGGGASGAQSDPSPGGAGGGGGGGGGGGDDEGGGTTRAGGGGGGGGGKYTDDGTIHDYRMYNVSGTTGGSSNGYATFTKYRSPVGAGSWTLIGSTSVGAGSNSSISIASI